MNFLDASALIKLVIDERETVALKGWLEEQAAKAVGSEVLVVELLRACGRVDPEALPTARAVLARVELVPSTRALLEDAAELRPPHLRSLDALHLASALSVRDDLSAFVAYDHRVAAAATAAGLPVVAPGT